MQDDPYEKDGWFGREQVADQTPVDQVPNRAPSLPAARRPRPIVNTWTVTGQLRASNNSALTFRPPPQPWYRSRLATIALIVAAAAAVAVPVVLLVLPSSPATGPEESTSVAPQTSTMPQPPRRHLRARPRTPHRGSDMGPALSPIRS